MHLRSSRIFVQTASASNVRLASVTTSQKLNAARTQENCQSKTFHSPKHCRQNKKTENEPGGEQTEVKTNSDPSKGCQIIRATYKYFHGHNSYPCTYHEGIWGVKVAPLILNLALNGNEWSASNPSYVTVGGGAAFPILME